MIMPSVLPFTEHDNSADLYATTNITHLFSLLITMPGKNSLSVLLFIGATEESVHTSSCF